MKFGPRPFRYLAVPVIALLAMSACDDTDEVSDDIAIVRVNVAAGTVLVDQNGVRSCCDGAGNATLNTVLVIPTTPTASRTALTVFTFHRSNGTPITLDPATHEVRVTPTAGSNITWTPIAYPPAAGQSSVPFSGNLIRTNTTASQVDVSFTVVEKASGNTLFGPQTFKICTTQRNAVAQTVTTPYEPAVCLT